MVVIGSSTIIPPQTVKGPDGPTGSSGPIGPFGFTGPTGATGLTGPTGAYVESSYHLESKLYLVLSDGTEIKIEGVDGPTGETGFADGVNLGSGYNVFSRVTDGLTFWFKGISGEGSIHVYENGDVIGISGDRKHQLGQVESSLSNHKYLYASQADKLDTSGLTYENYGIMNFGNSIPFDPEEKIVIVPEIRSDELVGITGGEFIGGATAGLGKGILLEVRNGSVYDIQTPIGIAGFTGEFSDDEVFSFTILLKGNALWGWPENAYFEKYQSVFSCGDDLINITTDDGGETWYATIAARGYGTSECQGAYGVGSCCYTDDDNELNCKDLISETECEELNESLWNPLSTCDDNCGKGYGGVCCSEGGDWGGFTDRAVCLDSVGADECDYFNGSFWDTFLFVEANPESEDYSPLSLDYNLPITCGGMLPCGLIYPKSPDCMEGEGVLLGTNIPNNICIDPCEETIYSCCKGGICIGDSDGGGLSGLPPISPVVCRYVYGGVPVASLPETPLEDRGCGSVDCCDYTTYRGACCNYDGECEDNVDKHACISTGRVFIGPNTICDEVNCCLDTTPPPAITEACCFGDGSCLNIETSECILSAGTPQGIDTKCSDPNMCDLPPPSVGACCLPGQPSDCQFLLEVICDTIGGTYQGDDVPCSVVDCNPKACDIIVGHPNSGGDYPTIQMAIDASSDGDVVCVQEGVYSLSPTVPSNIPVADMTGKKITLRSMDPLDPDVVWNTAIHGKDIRRGIFLGWAGETAVSGESPTETIIDGLTIFKGFHNYGGGIRIGDVVNSEEETGSVTIRNCRIEQSNGSNSSGGGIYLLDGNISLINCAVKYNTAQSQGGGINIYNYFDSSTTSIIGCTITANQSTFGAGIKTQTSDVGTCTITNTTVCDNLVGQIDGPWTDLGGNYIHTACLPPEDGACCYNYSPCEYIQEQACINGGGNWQGELTTCADAACQVLGACCAEQIGGGCAYFTPYQCGLLNPPGKYQGDWVTCEQANCQPDKITGACCIQDKCEVMTEEHCNDWKGVYEGDDTDCTINNCPEYAACCLYPFPDEAGYCTENYNEQECATEGGTWHTGETCKSNGGTIACGLVGACCIDGNCSIQTNGDCTDMGGKYMDDNTECGSVVCSQDGACCPVCGDCIMATQTDCGTGVYWGDGTECANPSVTCYSCGACCYSDGGCDFDVYQSDCRGVWHENQDCSQANCQDVRGACCAVTGECVPDVDKVHCEGTLNGTFLGVGSTCDVDTCDDSGACCYDSDDDGEIDSCAVVTSYQCTKTYSGLYQGDKTKCNGICASVGICCLKNDDCLADSDALECGAFGGEWHQGIPSCAGYDCAAGSDPEGACCYSIMWPPGYDCEVTTEKLCKTYEDFTYMGDATNCKDEELCAPNGACCYGPGDCANVTYTVCNSAGGTWNEKISCAVDPFKTCPSKGKQGACCENSNEGGCTSKTYTDCDGWWNSNFECGEIDCSLQGSMCDPPPNCGCQNTTRYDGWSFMGTDGEDANGNFIYWDGPDKCGDCSGAITPCTSGRICRGCWDVYGISYGACCVGTGDNPTDCVVLPEDACETLSPGGYGGHGSECVTENCNLPVGGCWIGGDCVVPYTEPECILTGGRWVNECPAEGGGICCCGNSDCYDEVNDGITEDVCVNDFLCNWHTESSSCATNIGQGVCCLAGGVCVPDANYCQCMGFVGVWHEGVNSCTGFDCSSMMMAPPIVQEIIRFVRMPNGECIWMHCDSTDTSRMCEDYPICAEELGKTIKSKKR